MALAVVLVSLVVFVAAIPFAKVPLPASARFILAYDLVMAIIDLGTAALLFSQFGLLRSRALFVLSSGYVFTAALALAHALSYPGALSPTGLLGAGPQSTAWLYMFWHGGFPLFVIAYAFLKGGERRPDGPAAHPLVSLLYSTLALLPLVCGLTALATVGQDFLPAIMQGNRYSPSMVLTVSSVWLTSFAALVVLWWRRPHTVLDLWLMVVACAWIFDIALSAVFNAGRYDLGFYAGRIYGLIATSFVLIVLLVENTWIYARLLKEYERSARKHRQAQDDSTPGSR